MKMMLNYLHTKVLGIVMAAFAFITAFCQVLASDPVTKVVVFGFTVLCAAGAFLAYHQVRGCDAAVQAIHALFRSRRKCGGRFSVRTLKNEGEVKNFWVLDQEAFGEASVSYDHFLNWWRTYPRGVYAILHDGEMVGGIGIWPLKKTAFDGLMKGLRSEHEIVGRSIVPATSHASRPLWYIGGIFLNKTYRRCDAVRTLLAESLVAWYEEVKHESEVSLVTLAYSRDGATMLYRFGFSKYLEAENARDRHPIFVLLNAKPTDLQRFFARTVGLPRTRPARAAAQKMVPAPNGV